ncbi:MAG: Asp-tRNA(Asn)/Glu-tRNA(Gln) amidotransferase subunit GatC [Archaeoglobales archaeon]|nr:Asp-tRNA(Asn)/Glu-tRNA(Gln) amidotransferase subunit GatC [Archaeoglobales archaeon]
MVEIKDVYHVAELANIEISDKEAEKFRVEFEKILEYFDVLDEVPDVRPTYHVVTLYNVFREDKPGRCLTQEEVLLNTQHKEEGFFRGPKVVE